MIEATAQQAFWQIAEFWILCGGIGLIVKQFYR